MEFIWDTCADRLIFPPYIFSNQNVGFSPDLTVGSGEVFNEQTNVFDFGIGLDYLVKIRTKHSINIGLSFNNIATNHRKNFGSSLNDLRGYRVATYLSTRVKLNNDWKVISGFYFNNQVRSRQYLLKLLAEYTFNNRASFEFGMLGRVNDAIIPYVGITWNKIKLGASYDINLSEFNTATQYKGGTEISLSYSFGLNTKSN